MIDEDDQRRRISFFETHLTRVPPERWGEVAPTAFPIEEHEWLACVEAEPDLAVRAEPDETLPGRADERQWMFKAYPEGTPIFYGDGTVYIVQDDPTTVEKMAALATRLQARIITEAGEVLAEPDGATELDAPASEAAPGSVRVRTEEERLRRRQSLLALVLCMVLPGWWLYATLGGQMPPPAATLAALGFLAVAIWAAVSFFRSRYFLGWDAEAGHYVVARASTKSTDDRLTTMALDRTALNALELVWFPLEYPDKTFISFHVRASDHPWLVLLESKNEQQAKTMLVTLANQLGLAHTDRTDQAPATDVPKRYQLTAEEKKAVSGTGKWTVVAALAAIGVGCWFGGLPRLALIAGLLAMLLGAATMHASGRPPAVPDRYRRWLRGRRSG